MHCNQGQIILRSNILIYCFCALMQMFFQASVNVWRVSKVGIVRCLVIAGVTGLAAPIDALVIMPTPTVVIQSLESVFANTDGKVSSTFTLYSILPNTLLCLYLTGVQCESMCETGRYGSNCQFKCDCGDNGSSCEAQSGTLKIVFAPKVEIMRTNISWKIGTFIIRA